MKCLTGCGSDEYLFLVFDSFGEHFLKKIFNEVIEDIISR